jgi:transmembrane sensor
MTESSQQSVSEAAKDAAVEWLVRLHRAGAPDWADPELLLWLEQDDQHRLAFADASALWFAGAELGEETLAVEEAVDGMLPAAPNWQRSTRPAWARAPAFLLSAVLVWVVWWFSPLLAQQYREMRFDLVGPRGGLVEVTVEDGTTIRLAPGAIAEQHYDDHQRLVILRQGAAFFDVSRNPDRPFIVRFGAGEVEVLGTAFGVESRAGEARVGVMRGRVRVAADGQSQLLTVGDARRLDHNGIVIAEKTPEQLFDWSDGLLRFENLPLASAIEQLRVFQSRRLLVLADMNPTMRVTASIDLERVDEGIETLAEQVGLTVNKLPGLMLIR